jgi:hypothetical protein
LPSSANTALWRLSSISVKPSSRDARASDVSTRPISTRPRFPPAPAGFTQSSTVNAFGRPIAPAGALTRSSRPSKLRAASDEGRINPSARPASDQ